MRHPHSPTRPYPLLSQLHLLPALQPITSLPSLPHQTPFPTNPSPSHQSPPTVSFLIQPSASPKSKIFSPRTYRLQRRRAEKGETCGLACSLTRIGICTCTRHSPPPESPPCELVRHDWARAQMGRKSKAKRGGRWRVPVSEWEEGAYQMLICAIAACIVI